MAEIEIRAERLEQYEQKAIEKQHNRRKNQMLNQGFSVSNNFQFCVGGFLNSSNRNIPCGVSV